jgi:hypothetical protein
MIKNKRLLLGFFGAVLVLLAICVSALSFNAHAAAPSATTTTVHAYIIKTTSGYVYKRTAITTALKNAFEFTNDTTVSQTVTYRGTSLFTIAAKTSASYTFPKAGTYLFKLASNRQTSLTVTVK